MIRPKLRSRMPSMTLRVMLKIEARLTRITSLHCSSVIRCSTRVAGDAGVVDQHVDRAELGLDLGFTARCAVGEAADVALDHHHAELVGAGLGGHLVAGVAGRDLEAVGLQPRADRPADAARAAGDERHPGHAVPPLSFSLRMARRRMRSRRPLASSVATSARASRRTCATPMPPPTQRVARPLLRARALHLVQQGGQDARAGRADRVADGDGAAVDVDLGRIEAQLAHHAERLGGEGLVGLDQVEVADLPAGLLQRLAGWPGSGRCP